VRWHLDDSGAMRMHDVSSDPAIIAVAIPPWLGDGIALFGDDGVAVASPSGLRAVARAKLTGPSIGAHELWARLQSGGDWVRLDLAKAEAAVVPPPIAAPLATPAPYSGRATTAGPEFGSQSFAVALVDLLGPVMTHDGGATWSPIDGVRAAFPRALPTRVLRDKSSVSLATEEQSAPVSQAGVLGGSVDLAKGLPPIPDVASVRVEGLAPFGVQLADGELLVADGPRLARVQTDPLRITRVGRDDSLTRCELGPAPAKALALAICMRHEEGSSFGGRVVAGTVVDGPNGPRLVSERTFPPASAWSMSASGALVVAARCDGSPEGGSDLLTATRVCVRDLEGGWTDLSLAGTRRAVVPRADGGVVVLRDDGAGGELVGWSRGSTPVATPARLALEPKTLHDVFRVDEVSPGRLIVWRKRENELSAIHVRVGDALVRTLETPKTILDKNAVVGVWGERAMIAVNVKGKDEGKDRLEGSLSVDGGRTWWTDAFPEGLRTLEPSSSRVECGPSGCRAFGWSRVGWEHEIAAHDHVVDVDALPRMAPAPAAPKRATVLTASCVSVAPKKTIDAQKALGLSLASSGAAVLLGLPAPKPAAGQALVIAPLAFGTVRGGLLSVGPASGSWGSNARTVIRFTSDLDPPGVVHESAPFAAPYADRIPAGVSASAFALGPGRIVVAVWGEGKTEVYRVEAGVVPEKIELAAAVTVGRVVSARELGGTLLLTGAGRKPDGAGVAPFAPLFDPTPFVALIDGNGAHAAFLAPGAAVDDTRLGATIDPSRGSFGVATLGSLPSWTGGTLHVLPLASDAHPGAGFSSFPGATSDVARPSNACLPTSPGWDRVETSWKALSLSIDKQAPEIIQGTAMVRTRASSSGVCLERFTFVRGDSVFQLDAGTRRAIRLALDEGSATAHRDELSCSFGWE
ncbi:MAG: hypothetical protein ACXVEE_42495, partial [Polyangiales bacterium]